MTYNIENELLSGEKILWQGRPATGLTLQPSDIFAIPFSLLWGGFAIFWELSALGIINLGKNSNNNHPPIFFAIWGLPFVAMGIYMIIGRFFVDAKIRSNTDYAITNQRVIIASGLFSRAIKSLNLKSIPDISMSERKDGSGTITFCEASSFNNFMMQGMHPKRQAPALVMIPDVRNVYALIRKQQQ